jgi:hypothetical protein
LSRKNLISKKFVDALAVSTTQDSDTLNLGQTDKASVHLTWTGSSPDITVTVKARNGNADTFRTLNMGGTIAISGASGEHELIFNELPFTELKLTFTRASGSATITANFTSKSVGA